MNINDDNNHTMLLPIEFYAFRRNARRAILGPGTLELTAFDRETLCAAERVEALPAVYLPEQLEKITGAPPESTRELEIELATCRTVTHAATIAYHIRDAVLIDGQIYAKELKFPLRDSGFIASGPAGPAYFKKAALASSFLGNRYFGHWLRDDCTTYLLAEQFSKPLCVEPSFPAHSLCQVSAIFCSGVELHAKSLHRSSHCVSGLRAEPVEAAAVQASERKNRAAIR